MGSASLELHPFSLGVRSTLLFGVGLVNSLLHPGFVEPFQAPGGPFLQACRKDQLTWTRCTVVLPLRVGLEGWRDGNVVHAFVV